jgi:hypothetical protein
MVPSDGDLEVDVGNSSFRDRPHNEHNTGSVETDKLQRADQTGPIVNTDEAPLSIAESSEQTLVPMTVSASSLADLGEDGPATVDISKLTTAKILDKRSSPSRVEYKCELEPLWLATVLVRKAQMGRVHKRIYEEGLIRAGRLGTLRARQRKLPHM